ncbi:MAG: beta-ketoacyl-[acyl-carrier-protein] synthase family protein [Acidobacteriota bacterium]
MARIVVTGLGWMTALGTGRDLVWRRLLAGACGTRPVRSFDATPYSSQLGGEVDPEIETQLPTLDGEPTAARASRFAVAAARQAVADAGLHELASIDPTRLGVAMGTTSGEPLFIERFNDRALADHDSAESGSADAGAEGAELADGYPCHAISARVAAALGWGGLNLMFPTACAAGSYALGHAVEALQRGRADVMVAGGADAFSRITYAGFARLGAIAPERCQPFDRERRGMVPGEGAAVLVLERLDDARRRGAEVYAEIAGWGLGCDAHHMTAAHPEAVGPVNAMRQALRQAGRRPEDVDYVSAHGTGTPTNDRLETLALHRVFEGHAPRLAVSSIKSMIGHAMGAASAIESAVCALAVASGHVPPTIHFETEDPQCDLDCVPNAARSMPVRLAMNNALAFGGNNASVLFAACDEVSTRSVPS